MKRTGVRIGCLVALLASAGVMRSAEEPVAVAIGKIKAVRGEGAGNPLAASAWKDIVRQGAAALPHLLTALDDADAIAANWLRSAVDAIAESATKAGRPLPAAELEALTDD